MANVRLDQNGNPKGPIYEPTAPVLHRSAVTAVDAADPSSASAGVDSVGYECCRFDVALTGSGITSLDLQVLWWNPRQSLWFGGASMRLTAAGRYALLVPDARGAILYLKVTAAQATSFNLSADSVLS